MQETWLLYTAPLRVMLILENYLLFIRYLSILERISRIFIGYLLLWRPHSLKNRFQIIEAILQPTWLSIIPPLLAVILAFITREAIISLAIACLVGVILMGHGINGFPALITRSLGKEDFIWICMVELCIGVMVAFFQRCGAVAMFTQRAEYWAKNRKQVGLLGWSLGLFIFFSDYFRNRIS